MKYNSLGNTHMRVSELSLGGAAFSNIYGNFDENRSLSLIKDCLRNGINYIETGPWYGQGTSEITIGKALKDVPRDSYFIASKIGRYDLMPKTMFDFSRERTLAAIDTTMQRLNVDHLDLIQIHDPSFAEDISVILRETLPALKDAVDAGKARFIGLADYDIGLMKDIIEESEINISTVLSYSKSTLLDNRLQNYTNFFKNRGIGVINAAVTSMGLLTNKGPQHWHPASNEIKELCKRAAQYCKDNNVELARIASWFTMNQPGIDTHVCGFYDVSELNSTLDVLRHGISEQELHILNEVKTRFFNHQEPLHWDGVEVMRHRTTMEVAI